MKMNNDSDNGMLKKQRVHVAVNYAPRSLITMREDYYKPLAHYHYNIADIPVKFGRGDKLVYPFLEKALAEVDPSDSKLRIIFNGPAPHWKKPPNNGDYNNGNVRIRVEAETLLRKLFSTCCGLSLLITGFIYRVTFREGRYHSINIKLPVKSDGTTRQKYLHMPSGLFGLFQLDGIFTVTLEWMAPDLVFSELDLNKKLLSRTATDLKITNGDEIFFCHSFLLMEMSPVFSAMLSNNTLESQTNEIRMIDTDGKVIEAFINFVNYRDVVPACQDSEICLGLLLMADKYCISQLENATKGIICWKPLEWISTSAALHLFLFSNFSANTENLKDIAVEALKSRKGELHNSQKFKEMQTYCPDIANQLME